MIAVTRSTAPDPVRSICAWQTDSRGRPRGRAFARQVAWHLEPTVTDRVLGAIAAAENGTERKTLWTPNQLASARRKKLRPQTYPEPGIDLVGALEFRSPGSSRVEKRLRLEHGARPTVTLGSVMGGEVVDRAAPSATALGTSASFHDQKFVTRARRGLPLPACFQCRYPRDLRQSG